jgi:hypothetical protein
MRDKYDVVENAAQEFVLHLRFCEFLLFDLKLKLNFALWINKIIHLNFFQFLFVHINIFYSFIFFNKNFISSVFGSAYHLFYWKKGWNEWKKNQFSSNSCHLNVINIC